MLSKTALIALAAAISVDALSLHTPSNVHAASRIDIAWDYSDADPSFTLELAHPSFRQDFALANNVDPSSGGATIVIPALEVFDAQYVIRAVNVSNINQEYARTGAFSIEQAVSSTTSSSASTSISSATNPPSGVSTTGGTTTVSNTRTGTPGGSSTSPTSTGTSTGTGPNTTGGNNTPTNTPQNGGGGNGAASVGISLGAIAAGVFAAVGML